VSGQTLVVVVVLAVAVERLVELVVAARHLRWARERGAVEAGVGHYPVMVVIHTALLVGALLEPPLLDRPFHLALAVPMVLLVAAAQGLRWWCIQTLGPQWNTRVVVVPGLPLVHDGPYRWLRHPNYVAVVVEGVALPLVGTAWLTALVFTVVNAAVLATRIRCENRLLAEVGGSPA
jgi:methyltransferase